MSTEAVAVPAPPAETPALDAAAKAMSKPVDAAPIAAPAAAETPAAVDAAKPAEVTKAADAPAKVALELKMEGVSPEAIKAFAEVAGEVGLDSAKAQKIADMYLKTQAGAKQAAEAAFKETQGKWEAALLADKEFGGVNLEKNRVIAQKGLAIAGKEVAALLDSTGLGSHPAIVKHFFNLGKQQMEDSVVGLTGGSPSGKTERDLLADRYPSMSKYGA